MGLVEVVEGGKTRGERREERRRKRRQKMLQHGKNLLQIYKQAISKRLRRGRG